MKKRINLLLTSKNEHLITTFGQARLVTLRDGSTALRGARADDRTAAKEWISLFMHEAVPHVSN